MYHSRFLSSPVIRRATPDDADDIADVILNSNSAFIDSVFRNKEKARSLLQSRYRKYIEGVQVLTQEDKVIGVMRLHLPNELYGNSISYLQLIKHLGIKEGIRAGILLSHWDEYKLKPQEAYIEYIYIHDDWENYNGRDLLIDHAFHAASMVGAMYVTNFIPVTQYNEISNFESRGFVMRRKIHSPLAKMMDAKYTAWYRATYSLTDQPITVKEYVVEKLDTVKQAWQQRRREIFAAVRLVLALTIVPVVAGTLAYMRDYPIPAILWGILGITHLLGAKFYLSGSTLGRYGLIITMFAEGINLLGRAIMTTSWFDRSWLIPLSLTTFWIASVLIRNPQASPDPTITTA